MVLDHSRSHRPPQKFLLVIRFGILATKGTKSTNEKNLQSAPAPEVYFAVFVATLFELLVAKEIIDGDSRLSTR